ncbi:hypothetical protein B9W68_03270 [Streptomyces sp. CS227]|nr:hypothetical protein B9W68_03270 [Streptomyces sp. CS227]
MADSGVPAAGETGRELIVRLASGSMAAQTRNLGGRERTREESAELCRRAGLALTSVTSLAEAAPYSLIEAVAG